MQQEMGFTKNHQDGLYHINLNRTSINNSKSNNLSSREDWAITPVV